MFCRKRLAKRQVIQRRYMILGHYATTNVYGKIKNKHTRFQPVEFIIKTFLNVKTKFRFERTRKKMTCYQVSIIVGIFLYHRCSYRNKLSMMFIVRLLASCEKEVIRIQCVHRNREHLITLCITHIFEFSFPNMNLEYMVR